MTGGGFTGGSFLNYQEDISSMLMAAGLALAMSAYLALLHSIPAPQPSLTPAAERHPE